jgi:3-oxoacyl-[acyl-carrier-protein] synthase II
MDVVISGCGLVTGYGLGTAVFWRGVLAGERTLARARRFAAAAGPVAECPGLPPDRTELARPAVDEALATAGLDRLPRRTLVLTVGQSPDPAGAFPAVDAARLIPGPVESMTVSHACASVGFALVMARDWLIGGPVDAVLVVGAGVLDHCEYASMSITNALSGTAVRPFDLARDGTGLGEGSGALLLERAGAVRARHGRPLARLAGADCRVGGEAGAANDATASAACVSAALAASGPVEIGHVQAHATGTVQGDAAELTALDLAGREYGWRGVPVSGHKGAIGHLLHASGFPAVAAAVRVLRTGVVPGNPGLTDPMPTPPSLSLPLRPTRRPVRSVLVTSFGFGGSSAALVLRAGADR